MRKTLLLTTPFLLCLFACAPDTVRVHKPPPSEKLMVMPEPIEGVPLRSYDINGARYYPLPESWGFVQEGRASWYGEPFHGRPTSSGEIYNMNAKTAAHKTLPLGTYVEVVNQTNNRCTVVRINDRGPFVKGRIIDLSYKAGKEIGLIGPGVAEVTITALGKEVGRFQSTRGPRPVVEVKDLKAGQFTVQVGAFTNKGNALRLTDRLKVIFDYVEITPHEDPKKGEIYRVRVTRSKTLTEAAQTEKKLEGMGFEEAFIVSL